jgi:hypothetical protein
MEPTMAFDPDSFLYTSSVLQSSIGDNMLLDANNLLLQNQPSMARPLIDNNTICHQNSAAVTFVGHQAHLKTHTSLDQSSSTQLQVPVDETQQSFLGDRTSSSSSDYLGVSLSFKSYRDGIGSPSGAMIADNEDMILQALIRGGNTLQALTGNSVEPNSQQQHRDNIGSSKSSGEYSAPVTQQRVQRKITVTNNFSPRAFSQQYIHNSKAHTQSAVATSSGLEMKAPVEPLRAPPQWSMQQQPPIHIQQARTAPSPPTSLLVPSHFRNGRPSIYKIASKTFVQNTQEPEIVDLIGTFTTPDTASTALLFHYRELAKVSEGCKEEGITDGLAWGKVFYPDGWNLLQICWSRPDCVPVVYECMGREGVEPVAALYRIPKDESTRQEFVLVKGEEIARQKSRAISKLCEAGGATPGE